MARHIDTADCAKLVRKALKVDTSFTNVTLKDATYKRFVDAVGPIVKEYR